MVLCGALLMVLAACGSAQELAAQGPDDPTGQPSSSPTSPSPSPTATPTPTPTPSVARPKVRQCRSLQIFDLLTRVTKEATTPVRCANKHNAQTFATKKLTRAMKAAVRNGSDKKIYRTVRGYCNRELQTWLKADKETVAMSQFSFIVGVPTRSDLNAGADWVRCDVFLRNGLTKMVNLPRSTKGALKGPKGDDYHSCVKGEIATASSSVPCYKKHSWRAVSSVKLGTQDDSWPGHSDVIDVVKENCSEDVRDYLNTSAAFQYGYMAPTKRTWKRGNRYAVCMAKTHS